tara:strand:+ start:3487 stop:4602 length:1116 start_codon:yes stop_codon:yes gene_type:complete
MARLAAKLRGDERAMEEEAERTNPLSGRGATPSMGLSQYRGGADSRPVGAGRRAYAPRKRLGEDGHGVRHQPGAMANAMDMGLHLGKHLHSLHGAGFFDSFVKGLSGAVSTALPLAQTAMKLAPMFGLGAEGGAPPQHHKRRIRKGKLHFGSGSNSDTGAYEGQGRESDDREMTGVSEGHAHGCGLLGQDGHGQLKGGGMKGYLIHQMAKFLKPAMKYRIWRLKHGGFMGQFSDSAFEDMLDNMSLSEIIKIPVAGLKAWINKKVDAAEESGLGSHYGSGHDEITESTGSGMSGGGFLSDLGIPIISDLAGAVGLGHDEKTESTGSGRRRRAPAGANDGRRKRAEVVKRVMREKGMKMIEASKYVKAHGLY